MQSFAAGVVIPKGKEVNNSLKRIEKHFSILSRPQLDEICPLVRSNPWISLTPKVPQKADEAKNGVRRRADSPAYKRFRSLPIVENSKHLGYYHLHTWK